MLTEKQFRNFWKKVDKTSNPDGCWVWTADKNCGDYGRFKLNGKNKLSHILSYELSNGEIIQQPEQPRLCVLHRCDFPSCINPQHLFLGTLKQNSRDMVNKGRQQLKSVKGDVRTRDQRGSLNVASKLTEPKVVEIRELYAAGKHTYGALAKMYGVSFAVIRLVVLHKSWQHVK